jgi:hypothetical protein
VRATFLSKAEQAALLRHCEDTIVGLRAELGV